MKYVVVGVHCGYCTSLILRPELLLSLIATNSLAGNFYVK